MIPNRSPRFRWLWLLGALLVAGVGRGAPSVSAQTVEQIVIQRRLELRAARAAYEAARSAFSVVERQFSAALEEVSQARREGGGDRLERAYAQAQDRSVPYRDQEARLVAAQDRLSQARRALIEVISARMEQLVREMDAAGSAQQRSQLNALFRDLANELAGLEAEEGDTFRIDTAVRPEITFDPRDGPDDLVTKAELLERHAAVADSVIVNTDRQIRALNDRLRIQRQLRDFLAGTDRFDDTRVPVVAGSPTGDRTSPTDSTVVGARPLTLEERIENLRVYRQQLESYRDQLLIRATQFRRSVGGVAG